MKLFNLVGLLGQYTFFGMTVNAMTEGLALVCLLMLVVESYVWAESKGNEI